MDEGDRKTRKRRYDFYLRNGMIDTGVTANVFHVEYRILEMPVGKAATAEKAKEIYGSIYQNMLTKKIWDRMVQIRE